MFLIEEDKNRAMNIYVNDTKGQSMSLKLIKKSILINAAIVMLGIVSSNVYASERLRGTVSLDGSSTVFPISEAAAEEFLAIQPRIRVTVGVSGTGGGFKKFLLGETDINNGSRPIKEIEISIAEKKNIEFLELPIAFDGLSVVVNKNNHWVDHLTVAELHQIWKPGSDVIYWSDVRPSWPKQKIKLYGPGTDSGTFDYFTETINGKSGRSRPDYTASENDNTLVQGIAGDINSLGYFGFAYYVANKNKLNLVGIDSGSGPVLPSAVTIKNGSYFPLSRPIYIYVRNTALDRPEVSAFVDFYLKNVASFASEVGFIALPKKVYDRALKRVQQRETGTAYGKSNKKSVASLLVDPSKIVNSN